MKRYRRMYRFTFLSISIFAAAAGTLSGCASPWKRQVLYDSGSGNVFLYREFELDDAGERVAKGFSHPVDISTEEVDFLLRRLVHDDRRLFGGTETQEVFTDAEVSRLAEPLALALGAVRPDERVRFLITRSSLADLFTALKGVSGVAFQTGDTLNVAFDTIDEPVNEGDGGSPQDVSFPENPTAETFRHGLHTFEGTRIHQDPATGEIHRRWLEVDRPALRELMARGEASPERDRGPARETAAGKTPTSVKGSAAEEPAAEPVTEPVESGGTEAGGTERPEADYERVRDRLRKLKRLRDDGAITAEEYEAEYERIMKDL